MCRALAGHHVEDWVNDREQPMAARDQEDTMAVVVVATKAWKSLRAKASTLAEAEVGVVLRLALPATAELNRSDDATAITLAVATPWPPATALSSASLNLTSSELAMWIFPPYAAAA
jgi:hypothetical protein